jgi:menaquinone-dependent protoporphyrinogen oxidase
MDDTRAPSAPRVLVAYATASGSTAGVAERIADVLRSAGATVTCSPVGPDVDPAAHDAVIVGSAVHNMAWLPEALELLRRVPVGLPLWCFSVGGVDPRGRIRRTMAELEARRIGEGFPAGISPRDHRIFGGIIDMRGTPLWGKAFYRLSGGRPGDHRNWPAIEGWATEISGALVPATAGLPEQQS